MAPILRTKQGFKTPEKKKRSSTQSPDIAKLPLELRNLIVDSGKKIDSFEDFDKENVGPRKTRSQRNLNLSEKELTRPKKLTSPKKPLKQRGYDTCGFEEERAESDEDLRNLSRNLNEERGRKSPSLVMFINKKTLKTVLPAQRAGSHACYGLEEECESEEEAFRPRPKKTVHEDEFIPAKADSSSSSDSEFSGESDSTSADSDDGSFVIDAVESTSKPSRKSASKKVSPMKLKKKAASIWEIQGKNPPIIGLQTNIDLIPMFEFESMREEHQKELVLMEKRAKNPLMKIYPKLHTSVCPDVLTNREQQVKRIKGFITAAISPKSNANNRSIYISGVPGTGKTASVFRAIKEAQKLNQEFTYIYVNGLELVQPCAVFTEMYKAMYPKAKKTSAKMARSKLAKIFTTIDKKRLPVVLVVDELDMIVNQKQDIVYDIFDWAATDGSRLTVLAIANTLDLPERTLKQRVSSRLGFNREIFEPYGFQEIEEILLHRIGSCFKKHFSSGFLNLISRKVAAVSGDLRKAFELVRRGIEIAVENEDSVLDTKHAQKVLKETQQSLPIVFTRSLSLHQELFLRSILQEIRSTGFEEVDFHFVYRNYRGQCNGRVEEPMEMIDAGLIAISLERCGFIEVKGNDLVNRRIVLNNSVDEIDSWLKEAKAA